MNAELALEKELETYSREFPNLIAKEGKFVVISDDKIAGFWETYEDALQAGYEKFELKPFLVKRIQAAEQIQYFSRDLTALTACQ